VADLPEQVAQNLVRAGAASSSDVEPAILTTEAYKPARTIRKTISKAL
jgi:hypothetical protein